MATSANFNTADRIIRAALKDAKLLQEGDDPSSETYADCMNRLNDLVNLWQTQGIKLWLNRMVSVTLVAGTAAYTLPAAPSGGRELRVLEAYYVDSNSISRPLDILSWNSYNTLANKASQGAVTAVFPNKGSTTTTVTCWLVPDTQAATGTLSLLVQDSVTNSVNLSDTMAFPNEWYIALHWGLADEICTGQPQEIVQRCATRAKTFRDALEGWDVEDGSTSFAPNQEGKASSFR